MRRPVLHYIPFMPRTLCGIDETEIEIRSTGSRTEMRRPEFAPVCARCAGKLNPSRSQLSLLRWLAAGNEPGTWETNGAGVLAFHARERVIRALLDRGWIAEDWYVTPSGREVLLEFEGRDAH